MCPDATTLMALLCTHICTWDPPICYTGARQVKLIQNSLKSQGTTSQNTSAPAVELTLPAENEAALQILNDEHALRTDDQTALSSLRAQIDFASGNATSSLHSTFNGKNTTKLPAATASELAKELLLPDPQTNRRPWSLDEAYWAAAVPDPQSASQSDDTEKLQGLLDASAPALLPAGSYRITRPLMLNLSKRYVGFIGEGAENTVIDAAQPAFEMFTCLSVHQTPPLAGSSHFRQIAFAGLTLRGGRRGISLDCDTSPFTPGDNNFAG